MQEPAPSSEDLSYFGEVLRKAIHLIALVVPLGMALLGKELSFIILAPLAVLALTADVLRARSEPFARFIRLLFGPLMRQEELPPVGGPISINGATWVLISAALLALIFPIHIAVAAFVMFMVSDAVAALVGRRFGRRRWPGTPRTVEGSVGFLVTGLLIMTLFSNIVYWTGVLSVVLGCLAEVPRKPFNDNLRVPFVAALTLFLLEYFALGLDVGLFFG